jgi:hypothetical protein
MKDVEAPYRGICIDCYNKYGSDEAFKLADIADKKEYYKR